MTDILTEHIEWCEHEAERVADEMDDHWYKDSDLWIAAQEIRALRARVEELERDKRMKEMVDRALVGAKVEVEIHDDWHTITDKQIDAAWRFVIKDDEACEGMPSGGIGFVEQALAKCCIVRCEECGGSGEITKKAPTEKWKRSEIGMTCPTCNGHGWVVKDEK